MDREILFRGKPKDKDCQMFKNLQIHMQDGFIYGSLIVQDDAYYICTSAIKHCISYINNGIVTMVEVIPETVGQYTGLTDKNGTKIFEGDIVKDEQSGYEYVIKWFSEYACFALANKNGHMEYDVDEFEMLMNDLIVIDNIHDNPELINQEG